MAFVDHQRSALAALLKSGNGGDKRGTTAVVRLLDAPSHEFAASGSGPSPTESETTRPSDFVESNPMLGVRGARLLLERPELLVAQGEAIAHAICDSVDADGVLPNVDVLIPMVALASEMRAIRSVLSDTFFRIGIERNRTLDIAVGAMIETPRAALAAAGLATVSDFFSFGTNDLTQLTWGIARDDRGAELIADYQKQGLIDRSPFETLDGIGVVRLMALAAETGRANNEDLRLTMCGEHGGDPTSISIAVQLKIDSVSVSPYRVPAARLAAAHAVSG